MGSGLKPLQTSVKYNFLPKAVPETGDTGNKAALILPGPAVNGCQLVRMTLDVVTQRTSRDKWWGQSRVQRMIRIGSDLMQHAQCSDISSMPKIALHKTIAHAGNSSYNPL